MSYKEIILNTKELPSPEPMEMILNNLHQIEVGTYIKMEHRMSPRMLLPILANNGFDFLERELAEDDFVIFIFLKKDRDLKIYLEGLS